jgi:hypothetical protein
MKKKSLSVLIALSLAVTTALPAASVFADTTTPVVTAAAATTVAPASTYGVEYEAHVQSIGWQSPVTVTGDQTDVTNVTEAGTTGQSKRIEALKITGTNLPAGASIIYQTHVQSIGWQSAVTETGNVAVDSAPEAGTTGQSKRVEAVKITLAGLPGYAVEYQTHVQSIGWQAPVTVANGTDISDAAIAGTTGQSKRVEALKIEIVKTDTEKQAEVAAINAVAKAQASKAQADITSATTAVQAVQDATENATLTAQLNAINTAVTVSSVTVGTPTSLQVTFNSAPADPSKVAFNVTNEGTPVTMTTTWNSTNTVATLTYSSNIPAATYAVDVNNNGTDLGSTNVTVTAQQIAKIEITSTTLGVTPPTTAGAAGDGYATYKVLDQYGNDITTSSLAQGIEWTCGIGNITGSDGVLTITPYSSTNFLTTYTTATINGIDENTGTTASANLTVAQNQGTLSNITLNSLTCSNNPSAVLTAGDTTDSFYINYTATDLSGNPTNNYSLVANGLMGGANGGTITGLVSSNPSDLTVSLVRDPNNSNNALIQVTPTTSTIVEDEPIVITAFTSSGKSSSINVTLKKASALYKFSLLSPTTTVAAGDNNIDIPFTAVDQNGNAVTQYSDLEGLVSFSGSFSSSDLQLEPNADGTASLVLNVPSSAVQSPLTSQNYTIQAIVGSTGQVSSLSVPVQAVAAPYTLSVTTNQAVNNMQSGAVQNLDFGANFGDLAIKDQFGRTMDMTDQSLSDDYYFVAASAPEDASVTVEGSGQAYDNNNIQLKATGLVGSGTTDVTYTVMKHITAAEYGSLTTAEQSAYVVDGTGYATAVSGVSPVTEQYTVVSSTAITGYTVGTIGTLYDIENAKDLANPAPSFVNPSDYTTTADVYGLTAGGGKVALPSNVIIGVNVDDTTDFTATAIPGATSTGTPSVGVYANPTLNSTTPTASGNLIVSILGQDNLVHTAKTAITSKNVNPVAQSVSFSTTRVTNVGSNNINTSSSYNGVGVSGNNITMTASQFTTGVVNKIVSAYGETSAATGSDVASTSLVYLYGVDQYGTNDAPISTWNATAVTETGATAAYTLTVDPTTHVLTCSIPADVANGDVITLTGVTSNGLVDSVNIRIQ